MATKLKNLHVKKVDFVDEGANQQADIKIFKRKEQSAPVVTDLLQDPMKEQKSLFKRLMHSIGKSLGFKDEEIDGFSELSSEGIIQKGNSQTFGEKMTEVKRQKVADEMWSICYALQSSLQSILYDEDLDGATAQSMMEESVSEFDEIIADAISSWSAGKVSGIKKDIGKTDVESLKKFRDHLNENIEKAANIEKGEVEEMLKIDKSKMSPEERAAYDEIVKKYGFEEETVEKSSTVKPGDDIYKGLHPAVKAEIEALRKYREAAENKEFMEVAKKYEIIGKKPEELAPVLKSLRNAGGTAYDDMISTLDSMVAMADSSGVFSEIGKSCRGSAGIVAKGKTESRVESIAKGYIEKDPSLSYTDAVAKAWENNPDLLASYDDEAGF